jgi:hypothetical protein
LWNNLFIPIHIAILVSGNGSTGQSSSQLEEQRQALQATCGPDEYGYNLWDNTASAQVTVGANTYLPVLRRAY